MDKCTWPIGNNESLDFAIYSLSDQWNKVAGLYIFAHRTDQTHWQSLYVGQTDDFSSRIPNHEQWCSAVRLGATHIHARVVPAAAVRDTLERRLISFLQPPLNEQLRGALRRSVF